MISPWMGDRYTLHYVHLSEYVGHFHPKVIDTNVYELKRIQVYSNERLHIPLQREIIKNYIKLQAHVNHTCYNLPFKRDITLISFEKF